ncbi:MAG TPA: NIPSNAP family protein [Solirubrobacteraceae bacterium]|nr:NIPSNAP family protein [Solirubrobacteraceae bacterium]
MRWSPIVELRQYTLLPGTRDTLIAIFEANFVESQEDAGMKIIGTFRDLDDPNRFVWLRGFDTMSARASSLDQFYGGPVWQRHRESANRTMLDSDNVLLLRPATAGGGFLLEPERLASDTSDNRERGLVEALVLELEDPPDVDTVNRLTDAVAAAAAASGGSLLASFVTETSENTFPALPVREGEHVHVCFTGYQNREHDTADATQRHAMLRDIAARPGLKTPPTVLRLRPTERSLLTGAAAPTARPHPESARIT